ncbi:MAG: AMP-binding protein [Sterolibacterium sp.]
MNSFPPRHASALDYLRQHAQRHPDREAAVEGTVRLSYRDLSAQVEESASGLRAANIGPGRVVAYIGPPGIEYLITLLATFAAGATWVGLNPKYRSDELAYVIGHAQPCLVVVASKAEVRTRDELALAVAKCTTAPELVFADSPSLRAALKGINPTSIASHPVQTDILQLGAAVLVYTSGSTGKPKGACLTQANLVENSWWLAKRANLEGGRSLINLPINHVGCIADTTLPGLLSGGTLIFMAAFDAVEAARLIRDEKITGLGQVPTQYQMMEAAGVLNAEFLGTVKHLGWGGAAMPRSLIEYLAGFIPDLCNGYGLTECSGTVTITARGASVEQLAGSVGVAVIDGAVRIVGANGEPVNAGESGEVQICGPHVFPGYLRNEAATRAALTAEGWLRTGDTGCWNGDGTLRLVGRMTEMYKSGGYNIYPREIEDVLESHPGVTMAAVIGVADPLWGEAGYAFVAASPEAVDGASLATFCREHLAAYKVPKKFEVRAELPLLPIGKIDRKKLLSLIDAT